MSTYYAHGKLLLSGEYVVLDGATALAMPTARGQSLKVQSHRVKEIKWKSFDDQQAVWFEDRFEWHSSAFHSQTQSDVGQRLAQILNKIVRLRPDFIESALGSLVTTHLEFPNDWGLGSSSTLITNLAEWAQINPYQLLEKTFGGSGYDLACAKSDNPLLFTRNALEPKITPVQLNWDFTDKLWFVHLNEKKNSRDAIAHYKAQELNEKKELIEKISSLSLELLKSKTLPEFEKLINKHENLLSKALQISPIKEQRFPDFKGSIKSLGGWGGDFVLATDSGDTGAYFKRKGYNNIVPFKEMQQ